MNSSSMLYPRDSATRRVIKMDGIWKFQFDPDGIGRSADFPNGLPSPVSMPVPASFADFFTDKASREYTGDFWYETDLFIPEEWRWMDLSIRFGCATHRAIVFVNGTEVARHEGGFLPFSAPINAVCRFNESNRVVVLVNNELHEDCIPVGRTEILPDGRKMAKPYFDFFNYSGLQRSVWLVAVPPEHILDFSVRHDIRGQDANVAYQVETNGPHNVVVSVFDESGKPVAEGRGKNGVLTIKNVQLWDVYAAYLYRFVLRVLDKNEVVDEYWEDIGVRTVEIKGQDFLLNGRTVYLKGFGKHEDSDVAGRGYNPCVMKRDFELMKWIGANSFRTAHYPFSEEIYQMADKEGILIIDETPGVGLMASTLNFFDAVRGKQSGFFNKPTTPQLLKRHLEAVEGMIKRDKNHACVIAFSLLNEPETTEPESLPYLEQVFEKARALDFQNRPCSYTLLMHAGPDTCQANHLCDFIMLNRYYGWYFLGGNEISMAEMAFHDEMKKWQSKIPDKPFIISEYGADTSDSEHKLPSVMWSQEYQIEYLQMCHRVFDSYNFIRGEQVWAFSDFQTGENAMRMNGNRKGIFTRQRQPKSAAYYLKQRWENLPSDYKAKE